MPTHLLTDFGSVLLPDTALGERSVILNSDVHQEREEFDVRTGDLPPHVLDLLAWSLAGELPAGGTVLVEAGVVQVEFLFLLAHCSQVTFRMRGAPVAAFTAEEAEEDGLMVLSALRALLVQSPIRPDGRISATVRTQQAAAPAMVAEQAQI